MEALVSDLQSWKSSAILAGTAGIGAFAALVGLKLGLEIRRGNAFGAFKELWSYIFLSAKIACLPALIAAVTLLIKKYAGQG